ncbi:probable LRR receptor-like serine/threonine-protein kinase At3g47570 [Cornus florida]|uniref:probable LRR receptor-like serine/threonine-protein kinase At3g47570 n=1 Tax=Cornus florida TaxID=4283 RepID=UPI002898F81B|nr:probable LRR receptor-like serine/threonine-protein kinase At3g47570 [Cornus florida]
MRASNYAGPVLLMLNGTTSFVPDDALVQRHRFSSVGGEGIGGARVKSRRRRLNAFFGSEGTALIFEFMPNGTLESWLQPNQSVQQDPKSLDLIQRLNIAIDAASALDYLHHQCDTTIIHYNLKPSNVLLDNELCARVGDFGISRFLGGTGGKPDRSKSSSSIGIRGTIGYVAPDDSILRNQFQKKGDVYSYEILLREMLTGRKPIDSIFSENFSLHNYAKMALPDRVMEIAGSLFLLEEEDAQRASQHNIGRIKESWVSVLRIGVLCSSKLLRERMDIRDVLLELHKIRNALLRRS